MPAEALSTGASPPVPTDADAERRALVEAIHATETLLVLAVTGGGVAVITDLLGVPGASRTVVEIRVPYAESSLAELLGSATGGPAVGAVSQATAEAMAVACLARARHLAPDHDDVIGVACTAALVSERPKKGSHRAHLAVAAADSTHHQLVELEKGLLDRLGEDRVVADALLKMIATASGL
jgi:nicotinamide mononucleotide (NMN) deamidase PncC